MTHDFELSSRAERDLRRLGPADRKSVATALRALAAGGANLDVKTVEGRSPWRRLRVGDNRVLYRSTEDGFLVERIVNRRDLERAIKTL